MTEKVLEKVHGGREGLWRTTGGQPESTSNGSRRFSSTLHQDIRGGVSPDRVPPVKNGTCDRFGGGTDYEQ